MKRKIYAKLVEWKNQECHKPLILNGVRQCGKTYILKEFGRAEFDNLAYVSCDRNDNLRLSAYLMLCETIAVARNIYHNLAVPANVVLG